MKTKMAQKNHPPKTASMDYREKKSNATINCDWPPGTQPHLFVFLTLSDAGVLNNKQSAGLAMESRRMISLTKSFIQHGLLGLFLVIIFINQRRMGEPERKTEPNMKYNYRQFKMTEWCWAPATD